MPAKTEKQRKFFGAVLSEKKNPQKKSSPAVTKAAQDMTEKEIMKWLYKKKR